MLNVCLRRTTTRQHTHNQQMNLFVLFNQFILVDICVNFILVDRAKGCLLHEQEMVL